MTHNDSAIAPGRTPLPRRSAALGWGLLGVLAFSFTVPFTRVADRALSPLFIGSARAVVAALLAAVALAATRQRRPDARQWRRLGVVAGGIVVGFPLLTSYALTTVPASHGAVVIALLPAATATTVVLRTGERPPPLFWLVAAAGAAAAVAFAAARSGGLTQVSTADLLLFGAVVAAAIGYAEGGLLARELGAWQTVSWALVLSAPLMTTLATLSVVRDHPSAGGAQWAALAYLGAVSMFLGFFAWYRGLALGPMAQVSQVQLVQPVLTLCWAALLLGEPLTGTTLLGGAGVVVCAALAVRVRLGAPGPQPTGSTSPASATSPVAPVRSARRPSTIT
ncbi:Permease of the drug/metabolite transporter (DMT) superfamily [Jatrophihabitans endophyticus]|uniref:Permease of the drug/metabolite transporter (DMT) superfamily n=1 Tax=Jatrophihabitans endophyticus TaxID=1206085 RepID=A0A1M5TEV0_9ACTN|nr:DMT family transporter [Jatrophihabitans endophyticus]SHH49236.1 Permease of the drug/metabolite transporter (DMT) superfamily [Jatrophihabitans endophyticus]